MMESDGIKKHYAGLHVPNENFDATFRAKCAAECRLCRKYWTIDGGFVMDKRRTKALTSTTQVTQESPW